MCTLGGDRRAARQLEDVRHLVRVMLEGDSFSARKLRAAGIHSADDVQNLQDVQLLARAELVEDQTRHPPFGTNLGLPLERYVVARSTSGTTGAPLRCVETAQSLEQRARAWQLILTQLGVTARDSVLVGLRSAALTEDCVAGARLLGSLSIVARELREDCATYSPEVVVCMPTDALRLEHAIRLLVLTGEPGGHVPHLRRRLEHRLEARVADVYALAEVGVVAYDCSEGRMHVNESTVVAEVIEGELVITDLQSAHAPFIRYCTGDMVDAVAQTCACGNTALTLPSGVLGRRGDELVVRGRRLLPSAIENVARRHPAVVDLRLRVYGARENCELIVELEPESAIASEGDRSRVAAEVSEDLRRSLGLRIACEVLVPGSLSVQDSGRRARKLRRQ